MSADIALYEVFNTPTIHALALKIEETEISSHYDHNVVTLLKKGEKGDPTIFFIHDGSGDIHGYTELLPLIPNANCYGLRSNTLAQLSPGNTDLDAIVSGFIPKIKKIQSTGPFHFIGWSLGGMIAMEITRQLEQEGEIIGTLQLIDTELPSLTLTDKTFTADSERSILQAIDPQLVEGMEKQEDLENIWRAAVLRIQKNDEIKAKLKNLVPSDMRSLIPYFESTTIEQLINYLNTIRTLANLSMANGEITLLTAECHYLSAEESDIDIQRLDKHFENRLKISKVPGNHFTIMQRPLVKKLATHIVDHIRQAGDKNNKIREKVTEL